MRTFLVLAATFYSVWAGSPTPNVQDIVTRSSAAMQTDWQAAPQYSFVERDVESKHGKAKTVKSYRVTMIEGSPYNELIAINDQPLSPEMKLAEQKKLRTETARRAHESSTERQRRVDRYTRERRQDHEMMNEMTQAFTFTLVGEDTLNGHKVWVLDARPKPGYVPHSTETKVLRSMQGRLWISQQEYQWVRVQAEVVHPVSLYGSLAKVNPGTKFVLEQAPVTAGIWLPKHFSTDVNAAALGFLDQSSTDDESYRDYHLMKEVAQLHADKN